LDAYPSFDNGVSISEVPVVMHKWPCQFSSILLDAYPSFDNVILMSEAAATTFKWWCGTIRSPLGCLSID
jgi:hypothetical protein